MKSIEVTLPLPPKQLHPNARVHFMAKAAATKRYRLRAELEARHALGRRDPPRWKAATVRVAWYFKTAARRDRDNLLASAKAIFDGLADAGIVDNDAAFTHLPHEVNKSDQPGVVLVVEGV